METRANFVLIGVFTVLSVIAAAIFAVWIGNAGFDRQYAQYDVVFDGPVRGLEQGGEVRFNGIKVGEVTQLQLSPDDPQDVIARIRIAAGTPVKVDSVAQLEPAGLTGVAFIQILAGSETAEPLRPPPGRPRAVIASRPGLTDRLFQGGEGVIETTLETLARLNRLLDDRNIQSIAAALENIERATGQVAAQGQLLDRTTQAAADVSALARSAGAAAVTYDELGRNLIIQTSAFSQRSQTLLESSEALVGSLAADADSLSGAAELTAAKTVETLERTQRSLEEFDRTAQSLRQVGTDVSALTQSLQTTTTSIDAFFALGVDQTLPDINRAAQEVRNTAITFDQLAQRVDQGPQDFLIRPPSATVEWRR